MTARFIFLLAIIPAIGWSQIPRPDDVLKSDNLKAKKVKSFSETWTWYKLDGSVESERMMESWSYNKNGAPTHHWWYSLDMVHSVDSVIYQYDGTGDLLKETKFRRYIPQKKNAGGFFDLPLTPETVDVDYVYEKAQLKYKIVHNEKALKKHDTAFYKFDKNGNMIMSDDKRSKTHYQYISKDEIGKKTVMKKIHVRGQSNTKETFSDTVVTSYLYDDGKIVKEESDENTITYVYNDSRQMIKAFERGVYRDKPYEYSYEFTYNENGNLTEMKKYKEGILWDWERYEYNEQGFPVKFLWINVETSEIEIQVSRTYSFY